MGGFPLDAHRPPIFFFLGRPSSFFLMGVFVRFFLTPRKSKVLVKILFSHFSIFFMGRKLFHAQYLVLRSLPVIGGGKFGSWTHFFYFSSKFHFFENLFAHLSPIFFFLGRPSSSKKKDGRYFLAPIFRPSFFFPPIFRLSLFNSWNEFACYKSQRLIFRNFGR